jgi:peptide/nickel transport system substrate-binding protein
MQREEVALEFNCDSLIHHSKLFVPEAGKPGGTLLLPTYSEPVSFNPITTPGAVFYMYDGLVKIDGVTGEPEPNLAERWDVSEDGLTWTFKIRKGVQWSDSVTFSAYDVEFTFNGLIYCKRISPNISRQKFMIQGRKIEVNVLDSLTVQFVLPSVFAPFLHYMSQEILPRHLYERAARNGSFSDSLSIRSKPEAMAGTGPFILASYTPLNSIVYKKNPLYWRRDSSGNRLPYLDSLVYDIVSDLDEALQCFKNGEIHYLAADGKEYAELYTNDSGFSIFHLGPAFTSNFILFNQNTGKNPTTGKPYMTHIKQLWFRNKVFRKAVAYAIDRQRIIDSLMSGRGYAQWSPVSPAVINFYNPNVTTYPRNIEEARGMLVNEGFIDSDSDGILEDTGRNKVEFSLLVNRGNTFRSTMAMLIIEDLKELGFNVSLQQLGISDIMKKIEHPPYDWDLIMLGLSNDLEPHSSREVWYSSGKYHLWFPKQKKPSTLWEGRIDSLFDVGVTTYNMVKRKAMYDEWQLLVSDELPLLFTVRSERILCVVKKVKNINPALYGGLLHNIELLYIDDGTEE